MLQPTVTQRVRAFLDTEGVQLAPWTTLDDTYTRLYALLAERRDDPGFWAPLGNLMRELAAEAAAESTASVAELLGRTEIERLTAELRRALPGTHANGELRPLAEFTAALGAPVLCGFLLLGLAAATGCGSSEEEAALPLQPPPAASIESALPAPAIVPIASTSPEIAPVDGGTGNAAAAAREWFDGCALAPKGVLWRSIDRSVLGDGDKRALCDCFSALDQRWTNRLTYLFRNARPTEIAKVLEEMVTCCAAEDKAADAACGDVAKLHGKVQARAASTMSVGGVLYKGVSFD